MASGVSVRRNVSPGWPFWPPVFLPDGSRRLLTRRGFFSPSLDGGLPLLLLFRPRRRSSSATRAKSTCLSPTRSAFCTIRCSMSACKAAMFGGSPVTVDAGSGTGRSDSACVTDACRLRPRRDLSRPISAGDLGSYDDLYVRFFRVAERRIAEGTGRGVVCFISNHSWLWYPSYVVMRKRLLSEFDRIWVDNLNGSKFETGKIAPDGSSDPSVFSTESNREGIQVGTAVALLAKRDGTAAGGQVLYRDLWGITKREAL